MRWGNLRSIVALSVLMLVSLEARCDIKWRTVARFKGVCGFHCCDASSSCADASYRVQACSACTWEEICSTPGDLGWLYSPLPLSKAASALNCLPVNGCTQEGYNEKTGATEQRDVLCNGQPLPVPQVTTSVTSADETLGLDPAK